MSFDIIMKGGMIMEKRAETTEEVVEFAETTEEVVECAETTEEVVECAETTEEVVECAETTEEVTVPPQGSMSLGEMRFGITCTGEPIGTSHWLSDSSVCGDMVMALPSSVMIAGRSKEAGGVAVDMNMFLDSIEKEALS